MQFTIGQEKAIQIAIERYKNKEPYTVIAGYAGTGKTYIIKYIIDSLNISESQVAYIAYTGKASLVLKQRGCTNAMTAHKLLYNAEEQSDGTYNFIPKQTLDRKYQLIVVDELSMIPTEMWELLLTHKVYILALGDPGQLPPINGNTDLLQHPHAFLSEIVRQALDNPIIRLSMDIRNGQELKDINSKTCRIVDYSHVSNKLLLGADIVICGRNKTRHFLNQRVRKAIWEDNYSDAPIDGDKIICLQNKWNIVNNLKLPLINGEIGKVSNISLEKTALYNPFMLADFEYGGGKVRDLAMDYKLFTKQQPTINKENYMLYPVDSRPIQFDYGYAITCHKAQGSEWDKVVVFNEQLGDKQDHIRWLYTAVTRSSNKLVVVR